MEPIKIVLLGAGYGGILTAKKLAKKFKKNENILITIIDKKPYHTMLTELHEVAAGRVPEDAIKIDLKKIFAGRPVEVVIDTVTTIDFDGKVLKGEIQDYTYDYLVLGTGSKPAFFGCKGAQENCLTLWSYEDAVMIKEHVLNMFRKAVKEKDEDVRRKLLTFVVIGCGFTGVEMIGELGEWKKTLCKDFSVAPEEVSLYVADMLPRVLPMLEDSLIRKTERRLNKLGVEILTESSITEVKKDWVCINGKESIQTNTVIWAAGIEGSDIAQASGLEKKGRDRFATNDKLQALNHENVYVVGDNIFYIPEGEERPVPQMVENAEHSAATVSKNIIASIEGKELKPYKPTFHGVMVSIGGRYGVSQVGTPKKSFKFSGFIALVIKHLINIVYFLQVAGFNKVWTYMMHEFFHVPDNRSLVGGFFSKRSPNFWLVPLRMFLGYKWLSEGLAKLPDIIKDPTNIFLIPAKIPVSGASVVEGAEAATAWVEPLAVPQFIEKMVSASMDMFFYTPEGGFTVLATIFQTLMVAGEIAVGLCLLGGLFSAVASIVSILMGLMIWSSGMAPAEMLWYMVAAVACIGGSGSTFGLDYFVLPWLKKLWKKLKFVKKWYIYTE